MKPLIHARCSVNRYGGSIDDYIPLHEFIDSSKQCVPDMRHRAILHSSFGCYIVQEVFGVYIENSNGRLIATRDLAEEHIIEDMGRIPTVQDYLEGMPLYDWLGGPKRRTTRFQFVDLVD